MTTPFEAYQLFMAVKSHFTSASYDFFKYNKKVRVSPSSFDMRKDRFMFARLAKIPDLENFIVCNFACGKVSWVGDLLEDEADNTYQQWLKRKQSLTYMFKSELEPYEDFKSLFKIVDGQYPKLLILYRQKKISIETMAILDSVLTFTPVWTRLINDTIIWPAMRDKILKYQPFVKYDEEKIKKILKDLVETHK